MGVFCLSNFLAYFSGFQKKQQHFFTEIPFFFKKYLPFSKNLYLFSKNLCVLPKYLPFRRLQPRNTFLFSKNLCFSSFSAPLFFGDVRFSDHLFCSKTHQKPYFFAQKTYFFAQKPSFFFWRLVFVTKKSARVVVLSKKNRRFSDEKQCFRMKKQCFRMKNHSFLTKNFQMGRFSLKWGGFRSISRKRGGCRSNLNLQKTCGHFFANESLAKKFPHVFSRLRTRADAQNSAARNTFREKHSFLKN